MLITAEVMTQEAFGWRTSEIPQYMYAQGKNLRVATLSDVDGAESWDFKSGRALMGALMDHST